VRQDVFGIAAAAALAWASIAQAAPLDEVHAGLAPLRARAETPVMFDANYFQARRTLHAWIDGRIGATAQAADLRALTQDLNDEITRADLACADNVAPGYDRCTGPNAIDARGYLGPIEVLRVRDYLVVETSLGVACGFDETNLLYQWTRGRWRPVMSTAQTPDPKGAYVPENIEQIFFADVSEKAGDGRLIAATGVGPACAEMVRPAHYRLWHVAPSGKVSVLVDAREAKTYIGRRAPAVSARFEGLDLLVEMDIASLDPRTRSRQAVRRFHVDRTGVNRVAPIALTPRAFVEEWLQAPWTLASNWTHADMRRALQSVHSHQNTNPPAGAFTGPTRRCASGADLLQVALRLPSGETFFLLRDDGNGAYKMLAAGPKPNPTCTRPDAALDRPRSLF
jgi:hypothetical protein